MTRRGLPIGIQTFRELRERNCYYVDKTAYVPRLLDEGKQRADRVLQQKTEAVGRQRPEGGSPSPTRLKQGSQPEVVDALAPETLPCPPGDLPGVRTSASGSTLQSTLARLAKPAIGLRSIPTLGMPSFLHSTSVVPVPQKGSRTCCVASTPNVSR